MPSYVARPHVLADEFVPGYLGDSFDLFPFVHGDPLANQFDGPFLVRLIRKEVTHISGFPFGIESRDPDIPSCWHSGTMRRSCCWSIPCHNQADPLPTNTGKAIRSTDRTEALMQASYGRHDHRGRHRYCSCLGITKSMHTKCKPCSLFAQLSAAGDDSIARNAQTIQDMFGLFDVRRACSISPSI
jgi:hypothetical protein